MTEYPQVQWPEFRFFYQKDGSFGCDTFFDGLRFGMAVRASIGDNVSTRDIMMRFVGAGIAKHFGLYVSAEQLAKLDWEDRRRLYIKDGQPDPGPFPLEEQYFGPNGSILDQKVQEIEASGSWAESTPEDRETPAEASSPLQEI